MKSDNDSKGKGDAGLRKMAHLNNEQNVTVKYWVCYIFITVAEIFTMTVYGNYRKFPSGWMKVM